MQKKVYIIASAISLFLFLILLVANDRHDGAPDVPLKIADREFQAEVARTDEEKSRGLSGRERICDGCAMLFLFDEKDTRRFHMRGMRFDLDIIFVADGKIVHIARDIPSDSPDVISPGVAADQVVEISGGLSREYGFEVGDTVASE